MERADRFLLLVRWQTLEAHTKGFRGSPDYQRWKALLHHFYDPAAQRKGVAKDRATLALL